MVVEERKTEVDKPEKPKRGRKPKIMSPVKNQIKVPEQTSIRAQEDKNKEKEEYQREPQRLNNSKYVILGYQVKNQNKIKLKI